MRPMGRSAGLATILSTLLLSGVANANDSLPNYNAYLDAKAAVSATAPRRMAPNVFGVVTSVDGQRGVPTFFWAPPDAPRPPVTVGTPEAAARFYLEHYAPVYRLSRDALLAAQPVLVHDV